jgi:hypothetical protein
MVGRLVKMAKKFVHLLAIFMLVTLLLCGLPAQRAEASPGWWNTDWSHRKEITISNSLASALANYQVKIDVSYESAMQADFDDLRFTNASDIPLDYWLESKTDGSLATVWVEVDSIAASGDTTIYMYYGNDAANSASNGDATFEFFDDFEDGDISDWSQYRNGTVAITDDGGNFVLLKTAKNDPNGGYSLFNNGALNNFEAVFRTKRINENGGSQNRYGIEDGSFNGYGPRMADFNAMSAAFAIERRTGGGGATIASKNTSVYEWNTWMTVKFRRYGSTLEFELYGSSGSLVESISTSHSLYNSFDRFVVHGGWEFYTDDIRVRKYVSPEPTYSVGLPNQRPDPPGDTGPTEYVDGRWVDDDTPTLAFTQNDPDGDDIQYRIQIIHDIDGVVVDYTSGLLSQGPEDFTVGQAEAIDGGSYITGFEGQTLDEGEYYWRVMSTDEHGATSDWTEANGGAIAFRLDTSTEGGEANKDTYLPTQDVEISASGFPPDSDVDVYVVNDRAWSDGDSIPADVGDGMDTIHTDGSGDLGLVVVWSAPLDIGEYDVVFDADQNGDYDEIPDLVDHPNHPGFTVVSPTAVGGEVYPINKTSVLLPWIGLAFILVLAVGGGALALRRR